MNDKKSKPKPKNEKKIEFKKIEDLFRGLKKDNHRIAAIEFLAYLTAQEERDENKQGKESE